jgi:hypothetical protein
MPQAILPLFSSDMKIINNHFAVKQNGDFIYWFQGSFPVFCHHVRDQSSFRSFCCQLINLGNATSAEISRALNVNKEKISRWARLDRSSKASEPLCTSVNPSTSTKKKPVS